MKIEQIEPAIRGTLIAIVAIAILAFVWEVGRAFSRAIRPTFTHYKVELWFCDGRKEVQTFITTGSAPSIRNDRRAVPEFGFEGGGANGPLVFNVCDFTVIEKHKIDD